MNRREDAAAAPPADDELHALFARARSGCEPSARAFSLQMRPVLFRVARSFLRDADDADDIAQEALVRALTRRFAWLPRGSAKGFVVRIAMNLAKNRLRDDKARRRILEGASARLAQEASAASPDDALSHDDEARWVRQALATLSARQEEVVRLRVFGALSFGEIAAALGIKEANARVTFSQAKARLAVLLRDGRAS